MGWMVGRRKGVCFYFVGSYSLLFFLFGNGARSRSSSSRKIPSLLFPRDQKVGGKLEIVGGAGKAQAEASEQGTLIALGG